MNRKLFWAAVIAAMLLPGCKKPVAESDDKAAPVVEVFTVQTEDTNRFQEYSGVLQPLLSIQVFPEVAGKVTAIYRKEGETVKTGIPLARIDQTDYLLALDQAKAALDLATANLKNAHSNLERQKKLQKEGFSSDATLEGIQTAYDIANAQYAQAQSGFRMAQRQMDRTTITAPIDGYISTRFIEKGQFATSSAPAYLIQNIDRLKLMLSLSKAQIARVSKADRVEIFQSEDADSAQPGELVFIGKATDSSGAFPIKIEVDNTHHLLAAGESVTIRIYAKNASPAVVVPGSSLIRKGGRWYVVVVEDSLAVEKTITPANKIHDKMIIDEGLKAGELLVITGQEYCKSGQPVKIVKTWSTLDEILRAN